MNRLPTNYILVNSLIIISDHEMLVIRWEIHLHGFQFFPMGFFVQNIIFLFQKDLLFNFKKILMYYICVIWMSYDCIMKFQILSDSLCAINYIIYKILSTCFS